MSKSRDIADSAATINYIDTVTSNVQDQIDNLDPLPSQTGNAGNFLTTDGTSASWGAISTGNQVDFVASGTIGNGATVILNNDGTVSVVAQVATSVGTSTVFNTAYTYLTAATFDSVANKIVVCYRDAGNSSYGTAIVGTVSGTSITFGTAVVFNSANTLHQSTTFDSAAGKVVTVYRNLGNSNYGTAIVGTVSGTSISFGTAAVFNSGTTWYTSAVFDSSTGKVIIVYSDNGNGNYGTAVVGTVSGTSISFGAEQVFKSSSTTYISAAYNSVENKVVIAYTDNVSTNYGTAIVGTVNGAGSNMSFGTPVTFESAVTGFNSVVYDSASNKIVNAYRDAGNGNKGTAVVGTVSGTSISFGTPVVFANASSYGMKASFSSIGGNVVIAYEDWDDNNYGKAIVGKVSGTSISFETALQFNTSTSFIETVYDEAAGKVVILYKMGSGATSSYGTAQLFTASSTNFASFIGISDAAISDTATGSVTIKGGVSTNVTSLTPATDYYVQADGSISATVSAVPAGKALSATSILLKGI